MWPVQLKRLQVAFSESGDSESIHATLGQLSQLRSLAVYDDSWSSSVPDGSRWEHLIVSSLSLLTDFQFYFKFWHDPILTRDLSPIVSSFSTPFYLNEKHWRVKCDVHRPHFSAALLYSMPFAFERFEMLTQSVHMSIGTVNSDDANNNQSYKSVRTLVVSANCDEPKLDLMNARIQHLVLRCPDTPVDWLFPMMHIRQLSLCNQINLSSTDFSRLINTIPRLDSLNVSYDTLTALTSNWENKSTCDQLASKVRSLNLCFNEYLLQCIRSHLHHVNAEECLPIVGTFGDKCQHLTIAVSSWNIVIDHILRTMRQLRSLKVYVCEELNTKMIKDSLLKDDRTCKAREAVINVDENEYTFWFHS